LSTNTANTAFFLFAGIVYESSYTSAYDEAYKSSKSEAKTTAAARYTEEVCPNRKTTEIMSCDPTALEKAKAEATIQADNNRSAALAQAQTDTAQRLFSELEYCLAITDMATCNADATCFFSTDHDNNCIPLSLAV
jgi:hypothetical protein